MKSAIPIKTEKASEKLEFEDKRQIELIMELVRKFDEDGELVNGKDNLIIQLKKK